LREFVGASVARGRVAVDCVVAGWVCGDDGVFCGDAIFEGAEDRLRERIYRRGAEGTEKKEKRENIQTTEITEGTEKTVSAEKQQILRFALDDNAKD
jgi:hypothetical protein